MAVAIRPPLTAVSPPRGHHPAAIDPAAIPAELRQVTQWTVRRAKVPYRSDGQGKAKSTDPATWSTFEQARTAVDRGQGDGLYYALKTDSGIVGVDLDHCVTDGQIEPWALAYVRLLSTWTCISPSGTGLRMFVKATKPGPDCKRGSVELYDRDRFLSITDQRVPGTPATIEPRQTELELFYRLAFPAKQPPPAPATTVGIHAGPPISLADSELIAKARTASPKLNRLWHGDLTGYQHPDGRPDPSSADIAFCNLAAWWTGRDAGQMDSWYRQSRLARPKWGEPRGGSTYGALTIAKAISDCREVYTGARPTQPAASPRPADPSPAGLDQDKTAGTSAADLVAQLRTEAAQKDARIADLEAKLAQRDAQVDLAADVARQNAEMLGLVHIVISDPDKKMGPRLAFLSLLLEDHAVPNRQWDSTTALAHKVGMQAPNTFRTHIAPFMTSEGPIRKTSGGEWISDPAAPNGHRWNKRVRYHFTQPIGSDLLSAYLRVDIVRPPRKPRKPKADPVVCAHLATITEAAEVERCADCGEVQEIHPAQPLNICAVGAPAPANPPSEAAPRPPVVTEDYAAQNLSDWGNVRGERFYQARSCQQCSAPIPANRPASDFCCPDCAVAADAGFLGAPRIRSTVPNWAHGSV